MSNQIEIKIEATDLSPEKFLEAVTAFFELVRGVAKNIAHAPVNWKVEVDKGSAVVRAVVMNPTIESGECIDAVTRGVRSIRSGARIIPPGFTNREVRAARTLADLNDDTHIQSIALQNGSSPEPIPKTIVELADAILFREAYKDFGSLEGVIDSLSARHGSSCSVYEPLLRREITCYFQRQEVFEEAISAFRKRVLVGGLVRYAKEGYPTSMVVETIRVFPAEEELPTLEEIRALFK